MAIGCCRSDLAIGFFPVHRCDEVIGGVDELGFVGTDEVVTTYGRSVRGTTGEGKEVAIIIGCHSCRNEATAFFPGLDNDHGIGETGDDAVTLQEIGCEGFGAGRKLGKQTSVGEGRDCIGTMVDRIDTIETMRRDDEGRDTDLDSRTMSGDVNAVGTTTDDGDGVQPIGEITNKPVGEFFSSLRRTPRTNDGYDVSFGGVDVAFAIKDDGFVGALTKAVRIVVIGKRPDTDAVLVDPLQLLSGTVQGLLHPGFIDRTPSLLRRTVPGEEGKGLTQARAKEKGEGDIEQRIVQRSF